jgi:hypothetical protein
MDENKLLELRRTAYKAVKEACKWLIVQRNAAPLEGFGPWSDMFVNSEQGIMNTCEGLTAMFVANEYNRKEDLHIPVLDQNMLISDVKWLMSKVEEEGYRGTPYLGHDTVENFIDAVSYGISVFLGARSMVTGTLKEQVEKHISDATNLLLSNKVEVEGTYGWSWMGSEEMKRKGVVYQPQTYFTYSALIPLCDVLNEAPDLITDIKADIINTIQGGKEFLIKQNRMDVGWINFEPTEDLVPHLYVDLDPRPNIVPTIYAILTLSYIKNNVQSITFEKEDEKIISDAVNWVTGLIGKRKNLIFQLKEYYVLYSQEEEKSYFDGCAPYTILNALAEYYNAYPEVKTEEQEKTLYDIAQVILNKLWGQENSGFRHIVSRKSDAKENILVVYATSIAIQALLDFGVERPAVVNIEDIIKEELNGAQTRILERLKEIGIKLKIPVHGGEEEELISQAMRDKLDERYGQMFMKISGNLTPKELETWGTYGRAANVSDFLDLFAKNYVENDSETFKANIDNFENGYSNVLLKPQKNALSLLKKFRKTDIANENERRKKMKEVLEDVDNEIEKFLKKKGKGA